MMPKRYLVATQLLCFGVQVPSAHTRAQITGRLLVGGVRGGEYIAVKRRQGDLQKFGIFKYTLSIFCVVARVHHQKDKLKRNFAMPLQLLHKLGKEHTVLSARNANGDFVPRRNERVFLHGKHERRPYRLSVRRDYRTFYLLMFG
jgi:hypothetical protein